MDRLRVRPRENKVFSGFTDSETEKLESLFTEYGELSVNREFCVKVAKSISRSAGRAGKPIVKWAEVQSWFHNRQKSSPAKANPPSINQTEITPSPNVSKNLPAHPDISDLKKANESNQVPKAREKLPDLSELEFEAKSSRDGAWYDVERFLTHRFVSSGEAEVRVRFVGFGAEEDEWVNVKNDVRERSIPLENWECHKVKAGDVMLCLQERKDQAIYYDARIMDVQRKMHDIRGCRCIFVIEYDHDKSEEKVRLRRLCRMA
ncbi:protein SAWADEE HOMEODOMAIN HOMOLOG 1 [Beta vulgaris subsp. vulgaris]|uniref:protein SAWADEE HOMEODOMAIN HOMOLOG 1 n=1 Tax=Beta vulgaris subsp. vulgaris TaxID=3555 RepID=UPI0020370D4C|nr:protein SAWADEE HOMEODOMAIN HOMOLOG 1 [Beta vulgaris subsp. vulgaris]